MQRIKWVGCIVSDAMAQNTTADGGTDRQNHVDEIEWEGE